MKQFLWVFLACFMALVSEANAGITCVMNPKTGLYEAKNRDDAKANEECQKRGAADVEVQRQVTPIASASLPTKTIEQATVVTSVTTEAVAEVKNTERGAWDVKERDQNMRTLFQRWGKEVTPEWKLIWEVDKDIPLNGEFTIKESGFKNAVLYITSLSSQSGVRVKPCFHSNYVARIISFSAACKIELPKGNAQ